MATSSIQGGERIPARPAGTDIDSLGPSDSSDSGSDSLHERRMPTGADAPDELGAMPVIEGSTSDAGGTGERASAIGDVESTEGSDIAPDRIDSVDDATADDEDASLDTVDELALEVDEEGSEAREDSPIESETQRER